MSIKNNTGTVYEVKEKLSMKRNAKRAIIAGAVVLLLLIVVGAGVTIIPTGNSGVVTTLGKISETPLSEGLNFKIPFIQKVAIISNKIQVQNVEAAAVSKDLQAIESTIAVNFKVANNYSCSIYQTIGQNYQEIVFLPAVQESVKAVCAKYTAEELISMRTQVSTEIKTTLEDKVSEYGIIIEKFNIVNFDFSAEFNAAIEAKQVAEQNLIKTKTEQEEQLVIARAEAEKKTIAAQAEAQAISIQAEAQSKANETLNASLSQLLLDYTKIQKWNGELPLATSGATILNIDDITE